MREQRHQLVATPVRAGMPLPSPLTSRLRLMPTHDKRFTSIDVKHMGRALAALDELGLSSRVTGVMRALPMPWLVATAAACAGYIPNLEWLKEKGCPLESNAWRASSKGRLSVLKYGMRRRFFRFRQASSYSSRLPLYGSPSNRIRDGFLGQPNSTWRWHLRPYLKPSRHQAQNQELHGSQ